MFVSVIHRIHDPEGFEAAEAKALEAGPPTVALPVHAATPITDSGSVYGKANQWRQCARSLRVQSDRTPITSTPRWMSMVSPLNFGTRACLLSGLRTEPLTFQGPLSTPLGTP